jgi:hypothetical protein
MLLLKFKNNKLVYFKSDFIFGNILKFQKRKCDKIKGVFYCDMRLINLKQGMYILAGAKTQTGQTALK